MTQAPPDRLDRIESSVERLVEVVAAMDKKLDIHIARTDERFNSIDQRFDAMEQRFSALDEDISDIKTQLRGQDARLWGFVVALFLALAGVLAKVVFFPQV
jgi:tetrahydromethanopterin S-methyltransferase subunit G